MKIINTHFLAYRDHLFGSEADARCFCEKWKLKISPRHASNASLEIFYETDDDY